MGIFDGFKHILAEEAIADLERVFEVINVDPVSGDVSFGDPALSTVPISIAADGTVSVNGTDAVGTITGDLTVSGHLTMAANKNILCAAGTTALDLSTGTGIFKTSTGTNTLSGSTVLAANKNLSCSAGTTAVDLSAGTGTFKTTTGLHTFGGKFAAGATTWQLTDPGNAGAIPVTSNGVVNLVTAGAETRTLAIPTFVGQRITLCLDTDGGDCVVTVASAYDQSAHTVLTFNDAGDMVELVGCTIGGTRAWRLVANLGAALS